MFPVRIIRGFICQLGHVPILSPAVLWAGRTWIRLCVYRRASSARMKEPTPTG